VSGRLLVQEDGDFATFLLHRGISVILEADRARRIGPSANPLVRAAQAARASLLGEVRALFGAREAGLLMGLALGDTSGLDPGDEEHFRATGLGHLLAVSGENVAMVLAPILGLALLLRLSAVGRFLLGGGAVLFFVVLTGDEPSVLRAGVMAGLALAGALLGRPRSTGSILAGAVLVLLVVDPFLVYSLGFQLSVAATAGIVALAGPLAARLRFLPRPLAIATATTLAAQAAVSPILLDQFHQVPWVTIAANVMAFPAVAPALLLGLAAAGVGLLFAPAGALLALLATVPIRYLEVLADQMASAPLPSVTSGGGLPVLLGGMAAVAALAWWLRSGRRLPRSFLVAGIFVLPLFVWATALRAGPPSGLVVHFFDVGQGDAALVRSPGGATLLIDGGPDPELTATKLAALGIKRLDAVVATHPHLDHFVGLPAVLARYPVGVVLDSGCRVPETRSAPYREFLRAVEREGVPEKHPREGDTWTVGDLTLKFLSPDRCWHGTNSDPNNDSLVILLTYREDSVLFANEPEADAQKAMLANDEPLTAQVMNVPHHGADTSWLPFLQAVHEEVAVISVGQPNSYGHPTPHLLHELRTTGPAILRTDRCGDVTVAFSPAGLAVDTERCPDLLLQSAG
jgi:competence protein ComEC